MIQTQSFNIVLPINLVRLADATAKKEYKNRSELIREALRLYLKQEEEWNNLFGYGQKKAKNLKIRNEKQVDKTIALHRHGK